MSKTTPKKPDPVTDAEIAELRTLHSKWRGGHVLHMEHPAVREFTTFIERRLPVFLDEFERLRGLSRAAANRAVLDRAIAAAKGEA